MEEGLVNDILDGLDTIDLFNCFLSTVRDVCEEDVLEEGITKEIVNRINSALIKYELIKGLFDKKGDE